tara:strand:+ start:272 stop:415 length:144 start_codon:yes stop_codon:yes gene_type:complete
LALTLTNINRIRDIEVCGIAKRFFEKVTNGFRFIRFLPPLVRDIPPK